MSQKPKGIRQLNAEERTQERLTQVRAIMAVDPYISLKAMARQMSMSYAGISLPYNMVRREMSGKRREFVRTP